MNQEDIIHFSFKLRLKNNKIHTYLKNAYGDEAMSGKAVENWTHQCKLGRTDIKDVPRPGRPQEES